MLDYQSVNAPNQHDLVKLHLTTAKELYEESGKDGRRDLSRTTEKLADIEAKLKEYGLAHEHFNMALTLHQDLLREYEGKLNNEAANSTENNNNIGIARERYELTIKFLGLDDTKMIEILKDEIKVIEKKLSNLQILMK
ncbi:unnamed protein product [Didymodactylos carnosus]|uniref:Uncharacterized protein n=1 Tax=Didymodactylos carnosus TaxID=1234261 RepID=A0A815U260_9BILA|nr:unnamed protein product [Didymodactylos carnosus]CAF4374165.1 unnamed protein product [Didymodactylos carnosus]